MDELLSSAELQYVLHISLRASAQSTYADITSASASGPEIDPKNPAVRRLIEQILFSRRFVVTYYLAIGGFVAFFTLLHQGRKIFRLRRGRAALQQANLDKKQNQPELEIHCDDAGSQSVASSSSSTLQGAQSPPLESSGKPVVDERTSLIGGEHAIGPAWRLYYRLRAFFIYQPAPIPAITSSHNLLPDNGTSLLVGAFFSLNLFYLFYHTPLSIPMLFALADRAGLCFVASLPVLYALSAKNNQPTKWLTGWSYECLNIFHRRLGEWMTVLALLHAISMFGVWYTLLRPANFTLLRFLSSRVILLGLFTFLAYVILWVTSTGTFRKLYYECFLALHISGQLVALVLLYFHHSGSRPYVLAALAIWVIDRIILRTIVSPVKARADLKVAADNETVLLYCDINVQLASSPPLIRRRRIVEGWQPGQHVFVTIPALGFKHKMQAHPFTIASPAPPTNHTDTWPLQLIIRTKGGFSKDLLDFAKLKVGAETGVDVILDGPYGSNETLETLRCADRVCLFAGGSGIAVTYPYAWALLVKDEPQTIVRQSSDSDTRILGGEPMPATNPDRHLPKQRGEEFYHIWVRSSWLHQLWLTLHPAHGSMANRSEQHDGNPADTNSLESSSIGNLFSWTMHNTPTQEDGAGRPNLAWEMRKWVELGMYRIDGKVFGKDRSICVVVSGPDGMVRDVRNAAACLIAEGWNIEVHVEKFGW